MGSGLQLKYENDFEDGDGDIFKMKMIGSKNRNLFFV
jgi:hypothetical protein